MTHHKAIKQIKAKSGFTYIKNQEYVSFKKNEVLTLHGDTYKTEDGREISEELAQFHSKHFSKIITVK